MFPHEEISPTKAEKQAKFQDGLSMQELRSYDAWCDRCQIGEPEHCQFGVNDCRSHFADVATNKPPETQKPLSDSWTHKGYGGSYKPHTPVGGLGTSIPTYKAASLPYTLNYRCPSCGHWYDRDSDLADHVRFACPASADYMGLFAIKCECCKELDQMAKVRDGYGPKKENRLRPNYWRRKLRVHLAQKRAA